MKKRKPSPRAKPQPGGPTLFTTAGTRRRRALILPRYLAEDSEDKRLLGSRFDRAFETLKKWADLETKGHLAKKETALDANFLHEVFGALGYKTATQSPDKYQVQRNYTVPGVGTADGALGEFTSGALVCATAVIELKGIDVDLDRDKFNGRTPVQQCWDLPERPAGMPLGHRQQLRHNSPLPP